MKEGDHPHATSGVPDLSLRVTKKVKTSDSETTHDVVMDQAFEDASDSIDIELGGNLASPPKLSYKEKLIAGETHDSSFSPKEIIDLVREELAVGISDPNQPRLERGPFNPNPVIPISLEEYDEWCRPWKYTLVVKLLGKNIGFRWMNQRIHRLWDREGDVKVIDLTDEHYLVRFAAEKDYLHALFDGPWMVADHYLMVQRWRPMFRTNDNSVERLQFG